ncbi:cysteine--tRNA ligase [Catalinimonas niigatensis]|uniref:cysteine--tRNA ligase n=1 Tax=Catalinimonas niigatensis TaxID=1397264 RepID=UPI00266672EE|nr:cysteine--tRNA ligase [Catalinimonas niigatensis]WPP50556.1 cysteine--tRNA ligase [Catalinimonas niigatensis]
MDQKWPEQYPVYITNSFTRQKEKFKPLHASHIGIYVCGPTVYGDPHLGHARSAITFDVVVRYFRFLGFTVRYVRNITDVGHLEDEVSDAGEDKISKKARLEKLEPMEVVQMYTNRYHEALSKLNVVPPSIEPTASGHIPEQIKVIEKIIENGFGYEANGSIYFDLEKYAQEQPYGKLSGKILEDLKAGSRDTQGLSDKRSPHDFALWKKANPEHIMRWDSPWGEGFPGWHVECTTMCTKYLGDEFDIHGGGLDLQFPHHEAELAQSFGAFHKNPVRYWMHNNLVSIDGQKMSKSLGNFINLEEFYSGNHKKLEQAYTPMTVRFFILQAHYRSPIDFSNQALQAAEKGLQKLMNTLESLEKLEHHPLEIDRELDEEVRKITLSCYENMSDDFNTAKTIASLFDMSSKINAFYNKQLNFSSISSETYLLLRDTFKNFVEDVLGFQREKSDQTERIDALVRLFVDLRKEAKAQKDYTRADMIRHQLAEIGVHLKDEKGGDTTYTLS